MSIQADRHWQERLAARYLDALDAGDLDDIAALWDEAVGDATAEEFLRDLMVGVAEEEAREPDLAEAAAQVVDMARRAMPGAFTIPDAPKPLTVADVARRLESEPEFRRLSPGDRLAHSRLAADSTAMPDALGGPPYERWFAGLAPEATRSYGRLFHKAAVMMAMSRDQHEGRLAAARRGAPPPDSKGAKP